MSVQTCLLPICHVKGELQTFKAQAIKTLILRSINIDDGLHLGLEALIDKSGDESSIKCHKSCYCSYTSRQRHSKHLANKRKSCCDNQTPIQVRRSQLPDFQFKEHCLICGKLCLPKDPKNPKKCQRIIQCETNERPGLPTFKDVLLDICEQRIYEWGRQVKIRFKGAMTDLPAADAQYHKKCYDDFAYNKINTNLSEKSTSTDDNDALNLLIGDM